MQLAVAGAEAEVLQEQWVVVESQGVEDVEGCLDLMVGWLVGWLVDDEGGSKKEKRKKKRKKGKKEKEGSGETGAES